MVKPLFIFSLPRSGSTLLQRLLASHPKISTSSEPWLLLKFMDKFDDQFEVSIYSISTRNRGISEFVKKIEGEEHKFKELLHDFLIQVYSSASSKNTVFFLDKTPRYYLIINEIFDLFPESKAIFLFRNPLQITASIISFFGKSRLKNFHTYYLDLQLGVSMLSNGYKEHKDKSIAIDYNDLVEEPKNTLSQICHYLELEPFDSDPGLVNLEGSLGDKKGTRKYKNVDRSSKESWKKELASPVRKSLASRSVKKMNKEHLDIMGYNKEMLLKEIKLAKTSYKFFFRDVFDITASMLINVLKPQLFFGKRTSKKLKKYHLS